jgi:hypothetical protein
MGGSAIAPTHPTNDGRQPPAPRTPSYRVNSTWQRLEQRAKRRTIIAVAVARELAGFCWAITTRTE